MDKNIPLTLSILRVSMSTGVIGTTNSCGKFVIILLFTLFFSTRLYSAEQKTLAHIFFCFPIVASQSRGWVYLCVFDRLDGVV